jgi:hypothetical protein
MSALIPALISLFMSRMKGGGGGGGGGGGEPRAPMSDVDKDNKYWERESLNPDWAKGLGTDYQKAARNRSPIPTWDNQ